jgi:hypothetical protein
MLIEIITAIITVGLVMWAFSEYLLWAESYDGESEFEEEKKDSFYYSLIPPRALYESRKIVYYWATYYWARYT